MFNWNPESAVKFTPETATEVLRITGRNVEVVWGTNGGEDCSAADNMADHDSLGDSLRRIAGGSENPIGATTYSDELLDLLKGYVEEV